MGNPSLEQAVKDSEVVVKKSRYSYLKVGEGQKILNHFLINKDQDETTIIEVKLVNSVIEDLASEYGFIEDFIWNDIKRSYLEGERLSENEDYVDFFKQIGGINPDFFGYLKRS